MVWRHLCYPGVGILWLWLLYWNVGGVERLALCSRLPGRFPGGLPCSLRRQFDSGVPNGSLVFAGNESFLVLGSVLALFSWVS